ncbi:hypothetical protein NQ317_007183, partial [Molorchus minor]
NNMAPKAPKIPLTREEKKALKLARKEERKRLKIEAAKQVKREYLGREIKYGQLTIQRHEREWRQMLINLTLPKMREDLEFAWHNFERIIDCKNFTISLLMDEIREAEEQYMFNLRSHILRVDELIDLFRGKIEELQEDYCNERSTLQKRSQEEVNEIKLAAEEEENHIKTMLFILDIVKKEQKQDVQAEYFSKLQETDNRNLHLISTLKGTLENKFQYLLQDTLNFLQDYEQNTKERRREHEELRTQDDALQALLVNQLEKIRKACEYVKILKMKLTDSEKILGRKLRDIQGEEDFFAYAFSTLKNLLVFDTRRDQQQLVQILHMSSVCRKLETQDEKIQPFPTTTHFAEDLPKLSIIVTEEDQGDYFPQLNLFWQRVAQAEASRHAINEERNYLKTENEILKLKLYEYCQCINCPSAERNVIQKGVKPIRKGINVTEGTIEAKKYEKHNISKFVISKVQFDT